MVPVGVQQEGTTLGSSIVCTLSELSTATHKRCHAKTFAFKLRTVLTAHASHLLACFVSSRYHSVHTHGIEVLSHLLAHPTRSLGGPVGPVCATLLGCRSALAISPKVQRLRVIVPSLVYYFQCSVQ